MRAVPGLALRRCRSTHIGFGRHRRVRGALFTASVAALAGLIMVLPTVAGSATATPRPLAFAHCLIDTDGDGVCDEFEVGDTDGDLTDDVNDVDDDGDGVLTVAEGADPDGDGHPDDAVDTDGDGTPDYLDPDDDGDGRPTATEQADPNGDGFDRDAADDDRDGQPNHLDMPTRTSRAQVAAVDLFDETTPNLTTINAGDEFGDGLAGIGDVDGNGVDDLAVGVTQAEQIRILFLAEDGSVASDRVIGSGLGGLAATIDAGDAFGDSIAGLGDLQGDGTIEIAVAAPFDDDGGTNRGAVHILSIDAAGSVVAETKISDVTGGLVAPLSDGDLFGRAVAAIGDIDGDGINDLAVGAPNDDDGGTDRGAVHVLQLGLDGAVKAEQKLSDIAGGFTALLDDDDQFGRVGAVGDVDGDGTPDVVVGAANDDDGGVNRGAVYVVFLNPDGSASGHTKISSSTGGLGIALSTGDAFGADIAGIGDLGGDGVPDIVVGLPGEDTAAFDAGALAVIELDASGAAASSTLIVDATTGLLETLDAGDRLGAAVAGMGADRLGRPRVAGGLEQRGPADHGGVFLLTLSGDVATVNSTGDGDDTLAGDGVCYTGVKTADGDPECTLRAALTEANASIGIDEVVFDIAASDPNRLYYRDDANAGSLGTPVTTALDEASIVDFDPDYPNGGHTWWRITPTTPLPGLTSGVTIDATTQLGARPNTTPAPGALDGRLVIELDHTSTPVGSHLLTIEATADNTTLRGLVVSGTPGGSATAITVEGADDLVVVGNYFGTDPTGTAPDQVNYSLLVASASDRMVIGTEDPADRNLTNSNENHGFALWNAPNASVLGNVIGLTATLDAVLDTVGTSFGIETGIGPGQIGTTATPNIVGGGSTGISVSTGFVVEGNIVGTDPTFSRDLGGTVDGIRAGDSTLIRDNTVGHYAIGVEVGGGTILQANHVGVDPSGNLSIPNAIGIRAFNAANTTVGGIGPGEGNVIAHNTGSGIVLRNVASNDVAIIGNFIRDNGGLPIDLAEDGVTPNDPGDVDVGPNGLLNHPVMGAITSTGLDHEIDVSLDVPAGSYRVELFAGSSAPPMGVGAGDTFLQSVDLVHTGGGVETFSVTVSDPGTVWASATATEDLGGGNFGSTSEFSSAVLLAAPAIVNDGGDTGDASPGDGVCDTGALNSTGTPACTLRAAIQEINASGGLLDRILFDIPASDPSRLPTPMEYWSIRPATPLPAITVPVTIDGFSQSGASIGTTVFPAAPDGVVTIELSGQSGVAGDGLQLDGAGSVVRGLAVNDFVGAGAAAIVLNGDDQRVEGSIIGLDITGTTLRANASAGVDVGSLRGVVGGSAPGEGNQLAGLYAIRVDAPDVTVQGNLVGTNRSGTAAVSVGASGIGVFTGGNTLIGGSGTGEGNLVSGNTNSGIWTNSSPVGIRIEGNRIGTTLDGLGAIPNTTGINVNADLVHIGSSTPGGGNLIAGNTGNGITLAPTATIATVVGNSIGVAADGTTPLPNNVGVWVNSSSHQIGGIGPGEGNLIAHSVRDNVTIAGGSNTFILGNSIHSSGSGTGDLGIDLGSNGLDVNDSPDSGLGANDLLNHPVIRSVTDLGGGTLQVSFDVDLAAGEYRFEGFRNTAVGSLGFGEGEIFAGTTSITHPGGAASYVVSVSASPGDLITLTTTEQFTPSAFGSTSEFSFARTTPTNTVVVNSTGTAVDTNPGDDICDTGGLNALGVAECTLRAAEMEADASVLVDTIHFDIPTADAGHSGGVWTIQPTGVLLLDTTMTVDASSQPGHAGTPVIALDGASAGIDDAIRIDVGANGVTIRGLAIANYSGPNANGIELDGDDAVIVGNHIGVDPSGLASGAFGDVSVLVDEGDRAVIGGTTAADRNLIGGDAGIVVQTGALDTTIIGNFIGVGLDGSSDVAGTGDGIRVQGAAQSTTIGGFTLPEGNVIGGWGVSGVAIHDVGTFSTVVRSNTLGISPDGTAAVPIGGSAIRVTGGVDLTTIENNMIGNALVGVEVDGAATNVFVDGNTIGTNRAEDRAHPLIENGVLIQNGATGVEVGDAAPNVITNAGAGGVFEAGVAVNGSAATEAAIVTNRIFGNAGIGIDLGSVGVDTNDAGDVDTGPNGLLNHPVLVSATEVGGGNVDLAVDLDVPAERYRIDLYANPSGADASGFGEGEVPLDRIWFDHPGGVASRTVTVAALAGDVITAVLTENPLGDMGASSEFSNAVVVASSNTDPIAVASVVGPIAEGDAVTLDASGSSDPDTDPLTYAWDLDGDGFHDDAVGVGPTIAWSTLQLAGLGDDGTHTIGLEVDDGRGGRATDSFALVILDTPPSISISGPTTAAVGQTVTVTVFASDPGNDTVTSWSIAWGDGTIDDRVGLPATISHTYGANAGVRSVTASVTNEDGTFVDTDLLVPLYDQTTYAAIDVDTGALSGVFGAGQGMSSPYAIEVGPDGRTYVSDFGNDRVLRFNSDGSFLDVLVDTGIVDPKGLAFAGNGDLLVASAGTGQVERFDRSTGAALGTVAALGSPSALHVGPEGELYVTDQQNNRVSRIDIDSGVVAWSTGTGAPAAMPVALEFSPAGEVLVSRWDDSSVVRLDPATGALLGVLVPDGSAGTFSPNGLTILPDRRLIVSDFANDELEVYDVDTGTHLAQLVSLNPLTGGASGPFHHTLVPHRRITITPNVGAIVNDSGDEVDATPGDGICDTGNLNSEGDPACTFRAAIIEANASPAVDAISFALPVSDPGQLAGRWRIQTATALPDITSPVDIDGSTQPGFAGTPVVVLDGDRLGSHPGLVLGATSSGSSVTSLSIGDFAAEALRIDGADAITVRGNWFGMDADGSSNPVGAGLVVIDGSSGTTVGGASAGDGNVFIGAPGSDGLTVRASSGTTVQGNEFGRPGLPAPDRLGDAISVEGGSAGTVIGGSGPGERNIILDAAGNGVVVDGATTSTTAIVGNLIGFRLDASTAGVIGADGIRIASADLTTVDANVIGNTAGAGVVVDGATNTTIQANRIGLDGASNPHPVALDGVLFDNGALNALVGGLTSADGNVIRNTGGGGVVLSGTADGAVSIVGNSIATSGALGIDLGADGVTANDVGDGDIGPNRLLNRPEPTLALFTGASTELTVDLDVPASDVRLEVFVNPNGLDPSGAGEGEALLTSATVAHAGAGRQTFTITVPAVPFDQLTVTATELSGVGTPMRTSEFSDGIGVIVPTLVVNDTGDAVDADTTDGWCDTGALNSAGVPACTLRAALAQAAATPSIGRIEFQMPATEPGHSGGVWTIAPASSFPNIDTALTIDGSTQTGWTANTTTHPDPFDGRPSVEILPSAPNVDVFDVNAADVAIRGFAVAGHEGFSITGARAQLTAMFIGTRADGVSTINGTNNVMTVWGSDARIGGADPADRVVIAGHGSSLFLPGTGALVQGSYFGVDASGSVVPTGDSRVVTIRGSRNRIGGTGPGEGNVIAGGPVGVHVDGGDDNSILGSSVTSTGGAAIDLSTINAANGLDANDPGDLDGGTNGGINHPDLLAVEAAAGTARVSVRLDLQPGAHRVEIFANPSGPGPAGTGPAEEFRGSADVVVSGVMTVEIAVPGDPGETFTATVTEDLGGGAFGSTSEISPAIVAVAPATITVNSTGDQTDSSPGDGSCGTGLLNSTGAPACTLRAALAEMAVSGAATVVFDLPVSEPGRTAWGWSIAAATPLPSLIDDAALDGSTQVGAVPGTPVVGLDLGATGSLVTGSRTTVRGVALIGAGAEIVLVDGVDGVVLSDLLVGRLPDGAVVPTAPVGIRVRNGSNIAVGDGASPVVLHGGVQSIVVEGASGAVNLSGVEIGTDVLDRPATALSVAGSGASVTITDPVFHASSVVLDLDGVTSTMVRGGRLGVRADGTPDASADVVVSVRGAADATIGGTGTGEGVQLGGHRIAGVVHDAAATGSVVVRRTSIEARAGEPGATPIDLGADGPDANDVGDADTGPNGRLNHPVLVLEEAAGTLDTTVTLDLPPGQYEIEIWRASLGNHPAVLASTLSATVGSTPAVVQLDLPGSAGERFVAIATNTTAAPATSEVSPVFVAGTANRSPDIAAIVATPTAEGGDTVVTVTANDPDGDPLTIRWDLDGDGLHDDATGPALSIPWAQLLALGISDDGTYPIGVRVDDGELVTTGTGALTVADTAPTLGLTGPVSVVAGNPATFVLSATDPGDDRVVAWEIEGLDGDIQRVEDPDGDGTATVTQTWTTAGARAIRIWAIEDDGTRHGPSTAVTVDVSSPPIEPPDPVEPQDPIGDPVDDAYRLLEDGVLRVDAPGVLANDPDGSGPVALLGGQDTVALPGGTLRLDPDGALEFVPLPDWFGSTRFSYVTSGGASATVDLEVVAVNDPAALEGATAPEQADDALRSVRIVDVDDGSYRLTIDVVGAEMGWDDIVGVSIESGRSGQVTASGTRDALQRWIRTLDIVGEVEPGAVAIITMVEVGPDGGELPPRSLVVDLPVSVTPNEPAEPEEQLIQDVISTGRGPGDEPPDALASVSIETGTLQALPSVTRALAVAILELISDPAVPRRTFSAGAAWFIGVTWFIVWRRRLRPVLRVRGVPTGDLLGATTEPGGGEVRFAFRSDAEQIVATGKRRRSKGLVQIETPAGPAWVPKANVERMRTVDASQVSPELV